MSSLLFTADELVLLTDLTGESVWALDCEKWHTLLRFKTFLWTADAGVVTSEVGGFAARLMSNDGKTHNLATFAAHIASRLPSVFYFHRTDIVMTTAGVVRGVGCPPPPPAPPPLRDDRLTPHSHPP